MKLIIKHEDNSREEHSFTHCEFNEGVLFVQVKKMRKHRVFVLGDGYCLKGSYHDVEQAQGEAKKLNELLNIDKFTVVQEV